MASLNGDLLLGLSALSESDTRALFAAGSKSDMVPAFAFEFSWNFSGSNGSPYSSSSEQLSCSHEMGSNAVQHKIVGTLSTFLSRSFSVCAGAGIGASSPIGTACCEPAGGFECLKEMPCVPGS